MKWQPGLSLGIGCSLFFLVQTLFVSTGLSEAQKKNTFTPLTILQHSRVRPNSVVTNGEEIIYTEVRDRKCGRNIYRYNKLERKEEPLANLQCVLDIALVNGNLYVNHLLDDESQFQVWRDGRLVSLDEHSFLDQMAGIALAIDRLEDKTNKDFGSPVPVRWTINFNEEIGVVYASKLNDKPLVLAHFSLHGRRPPVLTVLENVASERIRDFRLSNSNQMLLAFSPSSEGSGEVLVVADGKIKTRFKNEKDPKSGKDSGVRGWEIRSPESVAWVPNGKGDFTVLEGAGTRRAFVYRGEENRLEPVGVEGADIGSVISFNDGWIVSKPQTREILYFGSPFNKSEEWAKANTPIAYEKLGGKVKASYYVPAEFRDVCEGYSFGVQNGGGENQVSVSFFSKVELVSLGVVKKLVSYSCGAKGLAMVGHSFSPTWGPGMTELEIKPGQTNIPVKEGDEKIEFEGRSLLFLWQKNALKLIRSTETDLSFRAVRFLEENGLSLYRVWLSLGGEAYHGYMHQFNFDGTHFTTYREIGEPEKKESFIPLEGANRKKDSATDGESSESSEASSKAQGEEKK